MRCEGCATEVSVGRLSCPVCHRHIHKEDLERLAGEARKARGAGDLAEEIRAWREALDSSTIPM